MNKVTEHFGVRIRRARRSAGLNQAELARAVGVTRAAVSFWENGHSAKIESTNLNRLCKKLKVTHDYILNGIGPDPTPAHLDDETDMNDEPTSYAKANDDEQILQLLDELTTSQRTLYLLQLRELAELNRRMTAIESMSTASTVEQATIDTSALDELAAVLAKLKKA